MPAPITISPTPPLSDRPPGEYVIQDDTFVYVTIRVDENMREVYRRSFDINSRFESITEYLSDGTIRTSLNLDNQIFYTSLFNDKGWIIRQEDTGSGFVKTWDYDASGLITRTTFAQTEFAVSLEYQAASARVPEIVYSYKTEYFGSGEKPTFTEIGSGSEGYRISYDANGAVKNLVHSFAEGELSKTVDQWDDTAGARIPHRHLEYDQAGKIVLEARYDTAGTLTYETKTLDDGARSAMSTATDGQHIQITEANGSIRIQETIKTDGSLFVTKLGQGASVESTTHDDIFTSTSGGATFVFKDGFGADVIRNFHTGGANHDTIVLDTDHEVNVWAYNGTDTIITVGNFEPDTIILKGVNADLFHRGDILIV